MEAGDRPQSSDKDFALFVLHKGLDISARHEPRGDHVAGYLVVSQNLKHTVEDGATCFFYQSAFACSLYTVDDVCRALLALRHESAKQLGWLFQISIDKKNQFTPGMLYACHH